MSDMNYLVRQAAGATLLLLLLCVILLSMAGVLWFERRYPLTGEALKVQLVRRNSTAIVILSNFKNSSAIALTPARFQWQSAGAR